MCNYGNGMFGRFGNMMGHGSFMPHYGWWILGIVVIALAIFLLTTMTNKTSASIQSNTALDILNQQYAEGKISTSEYQERKENLMK